MSSTDPPTKSALVTVAEPERLGTAYQLHGLAMPGAADQVQPAPAAG